jgi:TIR domain
VPDDGRTYDVCLSYAGEHRDFVRGVWEALELRGIECFFDEPHRVELWGQDLAERFDQIYRKEAQFCVACVSREWVERTWPAHERRSALARMLEEPGYLLPVRFDDTEVPGLSPTIGYLDGTLLKPEELATLITKKVKRRPRFSYLPHHPNRLYSALEVTFEDESGRERVLSLAQAFLSSLGRLKDDERKLALIILGSGCTCSLPAFTHIPLEHILRRLEDWGPERILKTMRSLDDMPGFSFGVLDESEANSREESADLCLGWEPTTPGPPAGHAADVANAMIREAGYQACDECYPKYLERLDFSRTSSMLDWCGDDFEVLEADAAPLPLRDLVAEVMEEGWRFELTVGQIRFVKPNGGYRFIAISDPHDSEDLRQAEAALEDLLFRPTDNPG